MTVFFKTLSFGNGLSYQALLGLEWKIFCHSLWICFHCFIGYESLAAIIMVRCPYIYFQDSMLTEGRSANLAGFTLSKNLCIKLQYSCF